MLLSPFASAASKISDGGFESGTLQGWASTNQAMVAGKGTCFSDGDTTALSIRQNYAGLLRGAHDDQPSSLTSQAFTAGAGIAFLALSELRQDREEEHPFALTVSILDAGGKKLRSQNMATQLVKLANGCPSIARDQSFQPLYVSTRQYLGQSIKIRFTHHADTAKTNAFTLIDDVIKFEADEVPIYLSTPQAIAGVVRTTAGTLMLQPELPGINSSTPGWTYSWYINGENGRRLYFNPCIDDLVAGEYTATLYVNADGVLATDTIDFIVPLIIADDGSSNTRVEDPEAVVIQDDTECNAIHPSDLVELTTDTDLEEEPIVTVDPDTGEETVAPSISIQVLSVTPDQNSDFFSSVEIIVGSALNMKQAVLTLTSAGDADKLIAPSTADISPLTVACSSDTSCTVSGEADDGRYESAIKAFQLFIDNASSDTRTITVAITDTNNYVESDQAEIDLTGIPIISNADFNTLALNETRALLDNIDFTLSSTDATITSVVVTLSGNTANILIPPNAAELAGTGLSVSCSDDQTCTFSGDDSIRVYENTLIEHLKITYSNQDEDLKVTVTITDSDDKSASVSTTYDAEQEADDVKPGS